jgi:hypothetical membrane protein
MERDNRLLFGVVAIAIFVLGGAGLALMVPGYSHIRQTVSEIGEIGSPARVPFAVMLCAVAASLLVFATAVRDVLVAAGRSTLAAYLIGFMALPAAGTGIFAYPHPLHNIFGISELLGYQAPLAFALAWRNDPRAKALVTFSWIMFGIIWLAIVVNLSSLNSHSMFWAYVKPVHGLAQRALFLAWFGWCAVVGTVMYRWEPKDAAPSASPIR